jgi:enoyl-CoA hydratase
MPQEANVLLVETRDRIATVTLNRPAKRNALNAELRRSLRDVVRAIESDDDVDVAVLTGADPAFCAGLDLTEFAGADSGLRDASLSGDGRDRGPLGPRTKPIIGAVNGVAVTGGLELALACDFLIASEHARFADTHTRVGILPGWGLTVLLPEAVGIRRARQMSATGNYVDAGTALQWGLVNQVVAHDTLLSVCLELAGAVVSNDQSALKALLETYEQTTSSTAAEGWEIEARAHRAWTKAHLASPSSTDRLRSVIDRGRSQVADAPSET